MQEFERTIEGKEYLVVVTETYASIGPASKFVVYEEPANEKVKGS